MPYTCDISSALNIDRLFVDAKQILGGIDIFIANAGFAYYGEIDKPDWINIEQIYRTNVFSPLYCIGKNERA